MCTVRWQSCYAPCMKFLLTRSVVWPLLGIFTIISVLIFLIRFPGNYPDHTLIIEKHVTSFILHVTLPIKLAPVSLLAPELPAA